MKTFKQYRSIITEGGNARVVNKVGQTVLAQKVDLNTFGRGYIRSEVLNSLKTLDRAYKKKYGEPLWPDFKDVESGYSFNGSSEALMNIGITDDEYTKHKPLLGDVDVIVPNWTKENLWHLLKDMEDEKLSKNTVYIGCNKMTVSAIAHQINAVFEVTKGDAKAQLQVDFELLEYEDDIERGYTDGKNVYDINKNFVGSVGDVDIVGEW